MGRKSKLPLSPAGERYPGWPGLPEYKLNAEQIKLLRESSSCPSLLPSLDATPQSKPRVPQWLWDEALEPVIKDVIDDGTPKRGDGRQSDWEREVKSYIVKKGRDLKRNYNPCKARVRYHVKEAIKAGERKLRSKS